MEFIDEVNGIYGWYEPGTAGRRKTQDYFTGEITVKGKKVCDVYGNYMGYMDFNKVRYWDIREQAQIWFPVSAMGSKSLPSDSTKRLDSVTLRTGDVDQAQIQKENLENLQRHERKLREAVEAKRKETGSKFVANV